MKPEMYFILPSTLSWMVPIVIGLRHSKSFTPALRYILYYCLITFLHEAALIGYALIHGDNSILVNLYPFYSTFLMYMAYFLYADFDKGKKNSILFFGALSMMVYAFFLTRHPMTTINIENSVAQSVSMTIPALVYFIHRVFYSTEFEVRQHPFFYISAGAFIYWSTNLTILSVYTIIPRESLVVLWKIKCGLYTLHILLIGYAFYLFHKNKCTL